MKEISYSEVELFKNIDESELGQLLMCIRSFKQDFRRGETIFMDTDHIQYVGIVLCGSVHMIKTDIWGKKSIFAFFMPGELFGESFAVQGDTTSAVNFEAAEDTMSAVNFEAAEDTKVLFLSASNIIHSCPNACSFHAQIATNLFRLLGFKNQKFINKLEVLSKGSTRDKLLAYISQLAQEQHSRYVNSPLSRSALAEYLSVNRSAMIRELSRMRNDGIIDFDKDTFIIKERKRDEEF